MQREFDIVIVGGGIVGLSLANELIDTEFTVALVERNEAEAVNEVTTSRVSAINPFALQHFRQLGIFESSLAERICAYERMVVWDQKGAGQVAFDCTVLGMAELGAIIENAVLQQLLLQPVLEASNISMFCPDEISKIIRPDSDDSDHARTQLLLDSGDTISAKLLVGADGVRSKVRSMANIPHNVHPYQQQGVVCNITTSEPHRDTAWQCFMPTGPLALLPLYDGQCSIVWSLDDVAAQSVMAMDDETFMLALTEASEFRLGEVLAVSERKMFPLSHGHCEQYVQPGLALIGDAAHNIHPLAGQGANLGIADAVALAEVIKQARGDGRQWAALHTLKKYQRQRKGANRLMEASMTGFKNLFGNDNALVAELRNAGLSLVDHLPAVKHRLIRQALGV